MALQKEITDSVYAITLSRDSFKRIIEVDRNQEDSNKWENILFEKLESIECVSNVDYSGLFGPYIFLSIDSDGNTDKLWDEIEQIIETHLKGEFK